MLPDFPGGKLSCTGRNGADTSSDFLELNIGALRRCEGLGKWGRGLGLRPVVDMPQTVIPSGIAVVLFPGRIDVIEILCGV